MKKTCNGGHRTTKKGASTDPKKHFEVINFILGHFVNFLEEIFQEKIFDVGSPLINRYRQKIYNFQKHKRCLYFIFNRSFSNFLSLLKYQMMTTVKNCYNKSPPLSQSLTFWHPCIFL